MFRCLKLKRMLRMRLKTVLSIKTVIVLFYLLLCFVLLKNQRSNLLTNLNVVKNEFNDKLPYPGAGSFLRNRIPSNKSYCTFNYNLPNQFKYDASDLHASPQLGLKGTYRILYNVIEGRVNFSTKSVTYCTHLTPHFIYYLPEILKYWDMGVSAAIFVPDVDAEVTIQLLFNLCHCLPEMIRLSVHFVFPWFHPPYVMRGNERALQKCDPFDVSDLLTFRHRESLPYPVNVCRNAARVAAHTSHVLVSDVELIPSEKLSLKFLNMLHRYNNNNFPHYVFVIPVFEVDSDESIPRGKSELKSLYDSDKAVYFHRWLCQHCQRFPGLVRWLNEPETEPDRVVPFLVVKREVPFHRWEPIYIGTNREPFYSETLSWEGQQDKMTQMVEMCLLGYKFVILDGAFLVHWPGIKRRSIETKNQNAWRKPHQQQNTKQYDVIINYLASKYTENEKCKL